MADQGTNKNAKDFFLTLLTQNKASSPLHPHQRYSNQTPRELRIYKLGGKATLCLSVRTSGMKHGEVLQAWGPPLDVTGGLRTRCLMQRWAGFSFTSLFIMAVSDRRCSGDSAAVL